MERCYVTDRKVDFLISKKKYKQNDSLFIPLPKVYVRYCLSYVSIFVLHFLLHFKFVLTIYFKLVLAIHWMNLNQTFHLTFNSKKALANDCFCVDEKSRKLFSNNLEQSKLVSFLTNSWFYSSFKSL